MASLLDLKAELAAKEKEISGNKAAGKKITPGGQKKPSKVSIFHCLQDNPLTLSPVDVLVLE